MIPPDQDFVAPDDGDDDDEDDDADERVDLEELLYEKRADAAVLDEYGHEGQADAIRSLCDEIELGVPELFDFVQESEAVSLSGLPASWFDARFAAWEALGHAHGHPSGMRVYRRIVVPPKVDTAA